MAWLDQPSSTCPMSITKAKTPVLPGWSVAWDKALAAIWFGSMAASRCLVAALPPLLPPLPLRQG